MKTEQLVIVATEGGKLGVVKYVCADGMIGVNLINEKNRVDEWHPTQVREATVAEAVAKANEFMGR